MAEGEIAAGDVDVLRAQAGCQACGRGEGAGRKGKQFRRGAKRSCPFHSTWRHLPRPQGPSDPFPSLLPGHSGSRERRASSGAMVSGTGKQTARGEKRSSDFPETTAGRVGSSAREGKSGSGEGMVLGEKKKKKAQALSFGADL